MNLKKILQKIFPFLFSALQRAWGKLPKDQQDAIVNSGQIGQIIKTNLQTSGANILTFIVLETGLSTETVNELVIALAEKLGHFTKDAIAATEFLKTKLKTASSDEEWNGLLTIILNAGATLLSGGVLQWAQIALGLGEWAYQKFIKKG